MDGDKMTGVAKEVKEEQEQDLLFAEAEERIDWQKALIGFIKRRRRHCRLEAVTTLARELAVWLRKEEAILHTLAELLRQNRASEQKVQKVQGGENG